MALLIDTREFSADFIIGIGSIAEIPKPAYTHLHDIREGSVDYFSVIGITKERQDYLHCFDTTVRQGTSRSIADSIRHQALIKSWAIYDHIWKMIVLCGTHQDGVKKWTCFYINEKYTVGFSKQIMPSEAAIVNLGDKLWVSGGRYRESDIGMKYSETYSRHTWYITFSSSQNMLKKVQRKKISWSHRSGRRGGKRGSPC